MSVTKAKCYYLGQDGHKRMNCAQSVLSAFKERFYIDDELIEEFKSYGGGRAPDSLCGAYYAAKKIINDYYKDKIKEFEQYFIMQAGSIKCHAIREAKKLSCLECVEKSVEFVQENLIKK